MIPTALYYWLILQTLLEAGIDCILTQMTDNEFSCYDHNNVFKEKRSFYSAPSHKLHRCINFETWLDLSWFNFIEKNFEKLKCVIKFLYPQSLQNSYWGDICILLLTLLFTLANNTCRSDKKRRFWLLVCSKLCGTLEHWSVELLYLSLSSCRCSVQSPVCHSAKGRRRKSKSKCNFNS